MDAAHIDYRMARRALIADVRDGIRPVDEVCDAHPDLVRAGENVGQDLEQVCPICDKGQLRAVTYGFYGRGKERRAGRVVAADAGPRLAARYGEVQMFRVEVCPTCHWHHLMERYWVGRKTSVAGGSGR